MQKTLFFVKLSVLQCQKYPKGLRKAIFPNWKQKQDGNVPSRRHILGSKIFKEQLLEKFGKIFFSKQLFLIFFSKKVFFKSHNAEKLKKSPFRLIQRFLQTENFKKCKGVPFDKFRKFSKVA